MRRVHTHRFRWNKSDYYYTKNASFIKFCDRIANVTHSKNNGSRMFEKYKDENEAFTTKIFVPECEEVSEYLKKILEE